MQDTGKFYWLSFIFLFLWCLLIHHDSLLTVFVYETILCYEIIISFSREKAQLSIFFCKGKTEQVWCVPALLTLHWTDTLKSHSYSKVVHQCAILNFLLLIVWCLDGFSMKNNFNFGLLHKSVVWFWRICNIVCRRYRLYLFVCLFV